MTASSSPLSSLIASSSAVASWNRIVTAGYRSVNRASSGGNTVGPTVG